MYEAHFGLQGRPFDSGIAHDVDVFRGSRQDTIVSKVKLALTASDSVVTFCGPPGVGKTTLALTAVRAMSTRLALAWLSAMPTNPHELLELLLVELGMNAHRTTRIERLQMWRQYLSELRATESRVFVIAERTEELAPEVLRALDSLTGADASGCPGANVVLLGHPGLDLFLASPSLESLRQRIRLRQRVEPFSAAELTDYLRHRVTNAGGDFERLFTAGTAAAVYRYSAGVARLANTLCETALTAAAAERRPAVTPELVAQVAVELLGLPEPAGSATAHSKPSTTASTTANAAAPVAAAPVTLSAPISYTFSPAMAGPAALAKAPAAETAAAGTQASMPAAAPAAPVAAPLAHAAPPLAAATAAPTPVVSTPNRVASPTAPAAPIARPATTAAPPSATKAPPVPVTAAAPVATYAAATAPTPPPSAATATAPQPLAARPAPPTTPLPAATQRIVAAPPPSSSAATAPAPRPPTATAPPHDFDATATDIPDVSSFDFPVLTDEVDEPAAPAPVASTRAAPPPPARAQPEPKRAATSTAPPAPAAAAEEQSDLLRQTQTMRAISEAKSIDDVSDSMAETLFGEAELDFLSAALASAAGESDEPQASAPAASASPPAVPPVDDIMDLFNLGPDAPLELIDDSAAPQNDRPRKASTRR